MTMTQGAVLAYPIYDDYAALLVCILIGRFPGEYPLCWFSAID